VAILNSTNISDWYYFEDKDTLKRYLFENFDSNKKIEVSPKKLLQGFPGTLAMDIGGSNWNTKFSSLALILNDDPLYKDIFDLLKTDFETIKQFLAFHNKTLTNRNLLSSASINIDQNVSVNLEYLQKFDTILNFKNIISDPLEDFVGRTAKFYDTSFYVTLDKENQNILPLNILSGSINIAIDYDKMYFVNSETDLPFQNPQFYTISGSFNTYIAYSELDNFLLDQVSLDKLFPFNANCSVLIGDRYLELGQVNIQSDLSFKKENGFLSIGINFTSYARYYEEQT
jgi:hypothetical protein